MLILLLGAGFFTLAYPAFATPSGCGGEKEQVPSLKIFAFLLKTF
jgi:hypothetical protein